MDTDTILHADRDSGGEVNGKLITPLWIRRLHRRLNDNVARTFYQSPAFIRHRFGDGRMEIEKYVRLRQIHDPLAFSRALTVERMLRGQWIST